MAIFHQEVEQICHSQCLGSGYVNISEHGHWVVLVWLYFCDPIVEGHGFLINEKVKEQPFFGKLYRSFGKLRFALKPPAEITFVIVLFV